MSFFSTIGNFIRAVVPLGGIAARHYDNRSNIAASERAYQMQYQQNLDFWNRQNAYNDPSAQMRRFQAAGLSPHLIYGQTNSAGPIATAPVPTPESKRADLLEGLFRYQELRNSEAQHQLIEAQKDYAVQQAMNSAYNRDLSERNYRLAAVNQEVNRRVMEATVRNLDAKTAEIKSDKGDGLIAELGEAAKDILPYGRLAKTIGHAGKILSNKKAFNAAKSFIASGYDRGVSALHSLKNYGSSALRRFTSYFGR